MAANAIVTVRLSLDIPEEVIDGVVGRPDDESDEWREEAFDKLEGAVKDELPRFLEYVTAGEPEVEADIA